MRTLFHPFLPNGLFGDPALWVDLLDEGRSVLLDLGDASRIPARKLLRVDRVVVTHAHLDHFVGFDRLLRLALGRERELTLSGPAGFVERVAARIAGYTWNLIDGYPIRLVAEEIDPEAGTIRSARFDGPGGMSPQPLPDRPFRGPIHDHGAYTLHVDVVDHGIPVLAVALREVERLTVDRDRLLRLGLAVGPWLNELKQAVRRGREATTAIAAATAEGGARELPAAELARDLLTRRPGQKLLYATDLAWTPENARRVVALGDEPDLMVCEAHFLDADRALAEARMHLTARQAGELARRAGARRLAPVHLSARYRGREQELLDEAAHAFGGDVVTLPESM